MFRRVDPVVLGLVAIGGALGVLARAALTGAVADSGVVPWVTLAVNSSGSLLLGILVGWLGHRRARTRAFLGAGFISGFTTYSALALQASAWLTTTPWLAMLLVVGSLFTGVLGALAGLHLGQRFADTPPRAELPNDGQ